MMRVVILLIDCIGALRKAGFCVIDKDKALFSVIVQQLLRLTGGVGVVQLHILIVHGGAGPVVEIQHTSDKGVQRLIGADLFRQRIFAVQGQQADRGHDVALSFRIGKHLLGVRGKNADLVVFHHRAADGCKGLLVDAVRLVHQKKAVLRKGKSLLQNGLGRNDAQIFHSIADLDLAGGNVSAVDHQRFSAFGKGFRHIVEQQGFAGAGPPGQVEKGAEQHFVHIRQHLFFNACLRLR